MSWIFYTIAATILQTFRNLEQKSLNKTLDALTVSWSRFILPLPFAIAVIFYTFATVGENFIFYCFITAVFQVLGNVFLLKTFQSKNFSIGIAFYKTEVLQTVLLGLLFFHDSISFTGFIFAMITVIGVVLMSGSVFNSGISKFFQSLNNKSALYGLLCGFCFSASSFNLKFATQALPPLQYSIVHGAIAVLMWVIVFQNIFFLVIKVSQQRFKKDLKSLFATENKYSFLRTSILSFLGSVCWFIAFGIGKVVYIKVVGQVELIWSVLVSHFILKEKMKRVEAAGILLTVVGVVGVILLH